MKKKLVSIIAVLAMVMGVVFVFAACGDSETTSLSRREKQAVETNVGALIDDLIEAFGDDLPEGLAGRKSEISTIIINAAEKAGITGTQINNLLTIDFEKIAMDAFDDPTSIDPFKTLKDTGISSERLGRFFYAVAEGSRGLVGSFMGDEERNAFFGRFDESMGLATMQEFGVVFGAVVDMQGIMFSASMEMSMLFLYTDFGDFDITATEFRDLVKTNIDASLQASALMTNNVIDTVGTILKRYVRLINSGSDSEKTPAEINAEVARVDKYIAHFKVGMNIQRAVLSALRNDDTLINIAYKMIRDDALTTTESNNLRIAMIRYTNIAINNGLTKAILADLTEGELSSAEIDDIWTVTAHANIQYGAAVPNIPFFDVVDDWM
jgi:hypothetical protein